MRRLFSPPPPASDTRPAMMSIISLMVLLLPLVLMTTSARRLTGLTLAVPGPSEQLPPERPGPVERIEVYRVADGFRVVAAVRNTDVLAAAGDTEQKELHAADVTALQAVLATFKNLDPNRERVRLVPLRDSTTAEVVRWMDAVRYGPTGTLFPRVILETQTGTTP